VEHGIGDAFRALRSNFGLSLTSLLTKTISRSTANRCSYAFDHFAVDESDGRRSLDIELDAALALHDADIERFVRSSSSLPSSMVLPQLSTASAQRKTL
jgi:hypothetical protein